jgi:hypothetical protein
MALSGEVTKTYIIVKPEAAIDKERVSQLKASLIDASFIVVRDEFRDVTAEVAARLLKDEAEVDDIVGRCHLLVLARHKAVDSAKALVSASAENNTLWTPSRAASASQGLLTLFPRMAVDPIPSNVEAHELINQQLKPVLVRGLTEVAKQKPENSVKWLAEYLLQNNPNQPPLQGNVAE